MSQTYEKPSLNERGSFSEVTSGITLVYREWVGFKNW
ncbi:lasso RiPP family leader peptide-containing protein [Rhodococcus qingshengii]|nr:lasso RiPP family leader peptide-containing protein [Rhodococcus qingshengii]MBT2275881.1 lasso RiPP family leader peptide-containing protein [Rhodococcus qingshengii]